MIKSNMYLFFKKIGLFIVAGILSCNMVMAQLSPGDLSNPHAHLEGLSNCTQCHVLGNKVSADKCLACHTEVKERIDNQKGYHSSSDVKGKLCFSCHSEHNGKNFQLVRLDITKFDHNLTGFTLTVPHAKKECKDCHISKNISDQKLKAKKFTYQGVQTACLTCHEDYHHQTLSTTCLNCHAPESFKTAPKFNHTTARFQLKGKHATVDCLKCHKVEMVNGKKFQEFRGLLYANCTNCHKDPHQNKFGQSCLKCHTEETFHSVKNTSGFDHNKTAFKLEDKHLQVDCNKCHKTKLTDPLKHERCLDCHTDYHKGQFAKDGVIADCAKCHSTKGFTTFAYTIEQHNQAAFQLKGSHLAVPCVDCHRKQENWSFRQIGINCKDCHKDIHQRIIEPKYYPEGNCKVCHNESRWTEVTFDHSATPFSLTGAHAKQSCRSCHFKPDTKGVPQQKFYELSAACTTCHIDNHFNQFAENGKTDCVRCHQTDNWKASKFNHNNTAFKLDGKHAGVACYKCHKPQQEGTNRFVKYKIKDFTCEACHL
jgi:ribosomal protein S27E